VGAGRLLGNILRASPKDMVAENWEVLLCEKHNIVVQDTHQAFGFCDNCAAERFEVEDGKEEPDWDAIKKETVEEKCCFCNRVGQANTIHICAAPIMKENTTNIDMISKAKCTCGSNAIKAGTHSSWCDFQKRK